MKLTQKAIAALELPAGKSELIVFDDDLAGFGLRLRDGRRPTWIYQYRHGAKQRRLALGSAVAVTPARAREIASELHAKVRLGQDPADAKGAARALTAETVGAILENYLVFKSNELRPRSLVEVRRHLLKYLKSLHSTPLAKVDRRTVAAKLTAIAAQHGIPTSNRVRASLSAFYSWCMSEGLADSNPVIGTNKHSEKSRDRVLSDAELLRIWKALGDDNYSTIVRLLMLTGQRRDEIASLSWPEVAGDTIVLPASRTKNGRDHIVPLAPMARDILNTRARRDDDSFVFGRRRGKPFRGWGVSKEALDQRIATMSDEPMAHWTHHDLRRTMVTQLAEMGVAPHIIEAAVNHASGHKGGVAGIYNRAEYGPQKRIALQTWADHIAEVITGVKVETVVNLRRAGKSTQ